MTTAVTHKIRTESGKIWLSMFACLALAALQFVIAYQDIDASQMFRRMLSVAMVEAGMAELFFMHLVVGKAGISVVCVIFTISVLLGMQYGWTDSFRLVHCGGYCS